jgi:hypothetical protein
MKFSTNEDIEAPIDEVFQMFTEFDAFERSALRRGAEVQRTDSCRVPGVGMAWMAKFKFRGKPRVVTLDIVEYTPSEGYAVDAATPNLQGFFTLELMALSRSRTRASIAIELKPKSLSGRLMLQTLKLGKSRVTKSFKMRVAEFAKHLEEQRRA